MEAHARRLDHRSLSNLYILGDLANSILYHLYMRMCVIALTIKTILRIEINDNLEYV